MSDVEIECSECGWRGKKSDLLSLNNDDKERIYCPECGGTDMKDLEK